MFLNLINFNISRHNCYSKGHNNEYYIKYYSEIDGHTIWKTGLSSCYGS